MYILQLSHTMYTFYVFFVERVHSMISPKNVYIPRLYTFYTTFTLKIRWQNLQPEQILTILTIVCLGMIILFIVVDIGPVRNSYFPFPYCDILVFSFFLFFLCGLPKLQLLDTNPHTYQSPFLPTNNFSFESKTNIIVSIYSVTKFCYHIIGCM